MQLTFSHRAVLIAAVAAKKFAMARRAIYKKKRIRMYW